MASIEECTLAYWWNPLAFTACVADSQLGGGTIELPGIGTVSIWWLALAILILLIVYFILTR